MAVKIDIPGIGEVTAENAASEETLERLVDAFERAGLAVDSRENKDNTKAKKENTIQTKLENEAKKMAVKEALKESGGRKNMYASLIVAGMKLQDSMKGLGLSAVAVTAKFLSSYDEIAKNPITAGRDLINTVIDVTGSFAEALASAVPFIGEFLAGLAKVSAELLKVANNVFANELDKSVKALSQYTKIGASFAGGLDEMREVANSAGLGIEDFTNIVSKSRDELNKLGLSTGDAIQKFSGAIERFSKDTGTSGMTLRRELMNMGYTYEEQGELLMSFMANQQASGRLRSMTDREVAAGAREYATNLKVISDLTGKDAKELMNRARAESMRGALMTKLDADQRQAYMESTSMLSKAGPEVQAALTQFLTFGQITDPAIAASSELRSMVERVGMEIQAGNTNMTDVAQQAMADAFEQMRTSGSAFSEATDRALVAGISGVAADIAKVSNQFMAAMGGFVDPDAAKRSKDAAEAQASLTTGTTESISAIYDSTKKFQVQMENEIISKLPAYGDILQKTLDTTIDILNKAIRVAGGEDISSVLGVEKPNFDIDLSGGLATPGPGENGYQYDPNNPMNIFSLDRGGIASGPMTGYQAVLHGTEAVVPLPDGKSIPVSVETSTQTESTVESPFNTAQINALNELVKEVKSSNQLTVTAYGEMIRALQDGNRLSSGILQNTY